MKSNKFKKVIAALLLSAAVATTGFSAVACSKNQAHTHNWEYDWDTTSHWQVCKDDDATTEKEPHVDTDNNGKCDVCDATVTVTPTPGGETTGVYTITLNANGGGALSSTTVQTANGKIATLPSAPAAPTGKEFDGWYDAATGGNKITTNTVFTGAATIYAHWKDVGVTPTPPVDPGDTETATIHFHKPDDFGDTVYAHAYYHDDASDSDVNLTGDWMSYEVDTTDTDGWYTISVDYPEGLLDAGSFNLMIINEDEDSISVTINAAEMWVNKNGNLFASKAEAVADEAAPKVEYTIYYYAPDWTEDETVYVYTYNGPSVGGYNTEMEADGADGWYKVTFETTQEFDAFSVIFHTLDEETKHEFGVTLTNTLVQGKAFYFIDNGNGVYGSKADAELAYENPGDPIYVTVNVHKDTAVWRDDDVVAYIWGQANDILGSYGDTKMVSDGDGWYHIEIDMKNRLETDNYHLIIADAADESETLRFEYQINYQGEAFTVWLARDGHVCDDKDAVLAYEESLANAGTFDVKIHFQAPTGWTLTGDLGLHSWSNTTFGGFTGGWGATTMDPETGYNGWYTFTIAEVTSLASGSSAGAIFFDKENNDENTGVGRVTVTISLNAEIWVTADGAVSYTAPGSYVAA